MNSEDLIGLSVLMLIALCSLYGLHRITKPVSYTKEEYEKRLKKGSGIAVGAVNALMYPLQELWHPKAVEAVHVIKDMRQGYYDAQQESGDGLDSADLVVAEITSRESRQVGSRASRINKLFQSILSVFRRRS